MTFELPAQERGLQVMHLAPGAGRPIVTGAGDRDVLYLKAAPGDTDGAFSLGEYHAAAGSPGGPAHWHDGHEEGFYVVSGELTMRLGDEVFTATPGEWVFVPRGVVHAFSNPSPAPAVFLATFSPPGFERWLELRPELAARHSPGSAEFREYARRLTGTIYVE